MTSSAETGSSEQHRGPERRWLASRVDGLLERLPGPLGIIGRMHDEDLVFLAAGLAFYALVSVAPLVVLAFWVTGLVVGDDTVHRTGRQVADLLPTKLGVEKAFVRVAEAGNGLGVWALLGTLWPATAYGSGLIRAFDRLSGESRSLPGLRGRALSFALIGVLPVVALAGLAMAAVGPRLLGEGLVAAAVGWAVGLAAGLALVTGMTTLIYRVFTPHAVTWPQIVRGALLVGGCTTGLSLAYVLFLRLGANFEQRYASSGLAAVVLLAVWLFLANSVLLGGYRLIQEGMGDSEDSGGDGEAGE